MVKPKNKGKQNVTWAQAFRDITIKAMDRGQLLPLLFFIVIVIFAWKMPNDKVYEIFIMLFEGFKDLSLVGWLGMILIAILWASHSRAMRRNYSVEYQRIGAEKSMMQQQLTKVPLGSSDNG